MVYADNWIIWVILLLGFFCYFLLLNFIFHPRNEAWTEKLKVWFKTLPILLSALPLLGLLGTIGGLLETFGELARGNGVDYQKFLTSGIADALVTTQLGLVLVIPGWLLLSWLKSMYQKDLHQQSELSPIPQQQDVEIQHAQ